MEDKLSDETCHSPGLASLVEPGFGTWLKVNRAMVAAQLHSKFWGKSMKEEEQQWRDSQMSEDRRSRAQGEDEYMDQNMDEGMNQDANSVTEDSTVTEDADVTEIVNVDEDEDIIEGSYVLDTGIRTIKKIWIRTDYIRIYDCLEKQYNDAAKVDLEPGVVITGQPGIGEFTRHH
jgi:hypothetical protein